MSFPESDWKKLRSLKEKALNRYCAAVLDRLQAHLDRQTAVNAHQIYLDIYNTIQEDDELLAILFDDWRRSNAIIMLIGWVNHGLLTAAEFASFSEELRTRVTGDDKDLAFYPADGA